MAILHDFKDCVGLIRSRCESVQPYPRTRARGKPSASPCYFPKGKGPSKGLATGLKGRASHAFREILSRNRGCFLGVDTSTGRGSTQPRRIPMQCAAGLSFSLTQRQRRLHQRTTDAPYFRFPAIYQSDPRVAERIWRWLKCHPCFISMPRIFTAVGSVVGSSERLFGI